MDDSTHEEDHLDANDDEKDKMAPRKAPVAQENVNFCWVEAPADTDSDEHDLDMFIPEIKMETEDAYVKTEHVEIEYDKAETEERYGNSNAVPSVPSSGAKKNSRKRKSKERELLESKKARSEIRDSGSIAGTSQNNYGRIKKTCYGTSYREFIQTKTMYSCNVCEYTGECVQKMESHLSCHRPTHHELGYEKKEISYVTTQKYTDDVNKCAMCSSENKKDELGVCSQCGFNNADMEAQKLIQNTSCNQCDYKATNLASLMLHKLEHNNVAQETAVPCDQCCFDSEDSDNLLRHTRSQARDRVFFCGQCDFKTAHLPCLRVHQQKHPDIQPDNEKESKSERQHVKLTFFKCDQCSYVCANLTSLEYHKFKHPKLKDLSEESILQVSNEDFNHGKGMPFYCDQCNYKSLRLSSLKSHLQTHTGEKPIACDQCDYRTTRTSNLKSHMLKHTGEKPFCCDECPYSCKQLQTLKCHKLTHTGENPFVCDQCEYKSKYLSNLKTHKRTHTGAKPFACNLCDFKSAYGMSLRQHKLTHASENNQTQEFVS